MADSGDCDVNRKALQRVDPYIVQILESATQVALYRFVEKDNEWDKTGVEGSLFVYRRSAPPLHGFIIMNRLSKTNQIEPITKDLELQKEDPYLLYRNSKLNIFGIWFYDRNDCVKISDLTSRLLEREKEKHRSQQRTRRASESDTPVEGQLTKNSDILSLLHKAQDVYAKNKNLRGLVGPNPGTEPKMLIGSPTSGMPYGPSTDLFRPKAVRIGGAPDVTRISPVVASSAPIHKSASQEESLTVEALFASATKGQATSSSSLDSLTPALVSVGIGPQPPPAVVPKSNPLLQRLMSNPEHLVEHIERQQRNEFPVAPGGSEGQRPTAESLEKSLKEKLRLGAYGDTSVVPTDGPMTSGPVTVPTLTATPLTKLQTVLTPAMLESSVGTPASGGLAMHASLTSDAVATPSLFATPCKVLMMPPPPPPMPQVPLMPPMMFVATAKPQQQQQTTSPPTQNGFDGRTKTTDATDVFPLTKSRLCQALIYLLKNDAEFVTKLHEAYVKSTTDGEALGKT